MIDEVLSKLIEFLQEASPLVWETLIKQVYVEAVADIAWAIGWIVVGFILFKIVVFAKKKSEEEGYSMWEPATYVLSVGVFISGLCSFGLFIFAIMQFINPEFYAIRFIIRTIGGI